MIYLILIVFFSHFLFLICYPDTTFLGIPYLAVSFLLWTSFFILLRTTLLKLSYNSKMTILTLVYIFMIISIMSFYPQKDGESVYSKITSKKFPDKFSIYRGLKNIGIDYPKILK